MVFPYIASESQGSIKRLQRYLQYGAALLGNVRSRHVYMVSADGFAYGEGCRLAGVRLKFLDGAAALFACHPTGVAGNLAALACCEFRVHYSSLRPSTAKSHGPNSVELVIAA